jgi:hypothetical protein
MFLNFISFQTFGGSHDVFSSWNSWCASFFFLSKMSNILWWSWDGSSQSNWSKLFGVCFCVPLDLLQQNQHRCELGSHLLQFQCLGKCWLLRMKLHKMYESIIGLKYSYMEHPKGNMFTLLYSLSSFQHSVYIFLAQ